MEGKHWDFDEHVVAAIQYLDPELLPLELPIIIAELLQGWPNLDELGLTVELKVFLLELGEGCRRYLSRNLYLVPLLG